MLSANAVSQVGDYMVAVALPWFVLQIADSRLMQSPARQYLSELRDGLRFVRTSGLLISLIVIATVASMLEKPLMSVVAPV